MHRKPVEDPGQDPALDRLEPALRRLDQPRRTDALGHPDVGIVLQGAVRRGVVPTPRIGEPFELPHRDLEPLRQLAGRRELRNAGVAQRRQRCEHRRAEDEIADHRPHADGPVDRTKHRAVQKDRFQLSG
jgi:hypothetical protein